MRRKLEVLAPAGSYECLRAAVSAGADAVYVGGARFGARAYADNFDESALLEAIDYVHLHNRKIYLTVNTLLKEQEMSELYEYLLPYYLQGLDAVIVQDMGVFSYIREHFPDLPIHASTQMTVTNALGAKFLEQHGAERVVPARELSLAEVRQIADETNLEIECFVHGALCYCYSGQCLYSSLIGGRSGNRGQCAQPCRLPYTVEGEKSACYAMSLKDICTLEYLPELIRAGVCSFKIEGRMKKPEYVAGVTAMYRKYTDRYLQDPDAPYCVAKEDLQTLMDLYNRGGFHAGYAHQHNGRDMHCLTRPNHAGVPAVRIIGRSGNFWDGKALTDLHPQDVLELPGKDATYTLGQTVAKGQHVHLSLRREIRLSSGTILNRIRNEQLIDHIEKNLVQNKTKEKINGKLILSAGKPATLELAFGGLTVRKEGAICEVAQNQPMDIARIERQMRKTGNTEFEFESLDIQAEGNLFLAMQHLNDLRRSGLETLRQAVCAQYHRTLPQNTEKPDPVCKTREQEQRRKLRIAVSVETEAQFTVAAESSRVERIYLDCNLLPKIWEQERLRDLVAQGHDGGKEVFLALPHIFRRQTREHYEAAYAFLNGIHLDGYLVRNLESVEFLREHGNQKRLVLDYNLYQFNSESYRFWEKEGICDFTVPLELNEREILQSGCSRSDLIVYGYLPMMISAQCLRNTMRGCDHKYGQIRFTDRRQKDFVAKQNCDYCYNVIYNTVPLMLFDKKESIERLDPEYIRLQFTLEDASMARRVLKACASAKPLDIAFTRGHFNRGVK